MSNLIESFLIVSFKYRRQVKSHKIPLKYLPTIEISQDTNWGWPTLLEGESIVDQFSSYISLLMGPRLYEMSRYVGQNGHMACGMCIVIRKHQITPTVTFYLGSANRGEIAWTTSPALLSLSLSNAEGINSTKGPDHVYIPNFAVSNKQVFYLARDQDILGLKRVFNFECLEGIIRDEDIPEQAWDFQFYPGYFGSNEGTYLLQGTQDHLIYFDTSTGILHQIPSANFDPTNKGRSQKLHPFLHSPSANRTLIAYLPLKPYTLFLTSLPFQTSTHCPTPISTPNPQPEPEDPPHLEPEQQPQAQPSNLRTHKLRLTLGTPSTLISTCMLLLPLPTDEPSSPTNEPS